MLNFLSKRQGLIPCYVLALGFGSGLSPVMPGTVGSLVALLLWWLFAQCTWPVYLIFLLITMLVGIYVCGRTARDLDLADPTVIVWDEFVGLWITMVALPSHQWQWIMSGFVLFRILDISKPWPISWVDRNVHGGLGIMLDDVMAGGLAALVLWLYDQFWSITF